MLRSFKARTFLARIFIALFGESSPPQPIEEQIQSVLSAVALSYQDVAVQGVVTPYIVWSEIITVVRNSLGASTKFNFRIQIDCWGNTRASSEAVRDLVIVAMTGAAFKNIKIMAQNDYEPDTKLYREILDYSIWN